MRANLIQGDSLRIPLADGVVQCGVTSPPYLGLRNYGVPGQLGLEPTMQEYITNMVAVFDEVWRVLRDDGVVWLNMGDSYNGSGGAGGDYNKGGLKDGQPRYPGRNEVNLKPKDLMMVPHRLAIALQERGWWVRSDIVWAKPNPMPESVRDRPTKAHEYIFLLSKSARYFYDADAVREVANTAGQEVKMPDGFATYDGGHGSIHINGREKGKNNGYVQPPGRNRRTVWEITTKPYSGAKMSADYVGDDGKPYKVSPDCPIHGRPKIAQRFYKDEYDGQPTSSSSHSLGIDGGHDPSPDALQDAKTFHRNLEVGDENVSLRTVESMIENKISDHHPEPILPSRTQRHNDYSDKQHGRLDHKQDLPDQTYSQTAIEHNNRTRKIVHVHQTSLRDTACVQIPFRKHRTSRSVWNTGSVVHTSENNTSEHDLSGNRNSQKAGRNGRKSHDKAVSLSFLEPLEQLYCTCEQVSIDHFATFPPELPEICIKAGTSERGQCPVCGSPWERVVDYEARYEKRQDRGQPEWKGAQVDSSGWKRPKRELVGWRPTCKHDAEPVPQIVLDPFAGSGTTVMVAQKLGRIGIGLDLSWDYLQLARERTGLAQMDAWTNGRKIAGGSVEDLPLFAGK